MMLGIKRLWQSLRDPVSSRQKVCVTIKKKLEQTEHYTGTVTRHSNMNGSGHGYIYILLYITISLLLI